MILVGIFFAETNDRALESAGQDQTAHMCRLILLYTLHKPNIQRKMVGYGLRNMWALYDCGYDSNSTSVTSAHAVNAKFKLSLYYKDITCIKRLSCAIK